MATKEEFAQELHGLIDRYAQTDIDPVDMANELQNQVNTFIGQHNLEYELCQSSVS